MGTATKTSQEVIDEFWKSYIAPTNPPTKASAVLPRNVYAEMVKEQVPNGATGAEKVETTYLEAKKACEAKVAQIVKECMQINQKYSDPYFDLDDPADCLFSLDVPPAPAAASASGGGVFNIVKEGDNSGQLGQLVFFGEGGIPSILPKPIPPAVKRVGDIFDNPRFFVDGPSAKDIRQGGNGDCWFLSAITALCNLEDTQHLIERICVARDQDVGVYGFLLYRDGEWTSVIIDDKLFLRSPNYEDTDVQTRKMWENNRIRVNSAEEYRREFQSNSRALYYGQSTHPDETWVPLLEKAFAKAHGDYQSIEGGYVGDGIEDITGGLSTTIISSNILSRDRFWSEGLMKVNNEFLFGCGTQDWDDPETKGRDGIIGGHAYSILRAVEYKGERLVLVKNPWGSHEWNGPWSDGSSQWNADAIKDLGHTFGDDGIFWIRYADLLRKYDAIYRTRLFTDDWKVIQQWTGVAVPWAGEYQDTKFQIVINKSSPTVVILSQLDDRYFRGLTGQYSFMLSFRVHRAGEEEYIMRTFGEFYSQRTVNAELFLEAGTYEVRVKISAQREEKANKVEDVVKANWLDRREKLLQVGLSYDLAHAKGQVKDVDEKKEEPKRMLARTTTKVTKSTTTTKTTETTTTTIEDNKPADPATKDPAPKQEEKDEEEPKGKLPADIEEGENPYDPDNKDAEAGGPPPPPASDVGDAEDAWGAVAVVGLRVFCKDADATIQIIRPVAATAQKSTLDVDDPAVDATKGKRVVKPEEKKEEEKEKKTEEKAEEEEEKKVERKKVVEKKEDKAEEKVDGVKDAEKKIEENKDGKAEEKKTAEKDEEKRTEEKKDEKETEEKGNKQKELGDAKRDDWVAIQHQDEETESEKAKSEDTQTDDTFDDVKEEVSAKDETATKTEKLAKSAGAS